MRWAVSLGCAALFVSVLGCGGGDDEGGGKASGGGSGGQSGAGGTSGSGGKAGGGSGGSSGLGGSAGSSGGSGGSGGLGGSAGAPPACDQTLQVGADLAAAVTSAGNDSTICLDDGDYGEVDLFDISRTGFVNLRSTNGVAAKLSPQVGNSSYLRFLSLTISGSLVNNCSTHVHFVSTPFTDGLLITNNGGNCAAGNQDYLVDGASFDGVGMASYEGRLSVVEADGAVIKNSFFGNGGVSDGIQLLGGTKNSTIGPGNVFDGILQSICDAGGGAHCDAIQPYGSGDNNAITGNWFKNCDTFIMSPDGDTATVTDNVFDGSTSGYLDKIQFGSAQNPVFSHNTVRDVRVSFDSKTGEPASSNAQAHDNVMIGASSWKTSNGNGCSGCTFSSNLFDDAGDASGSNNVIGTPVFVGGSDPKAWLDWQLAAGSPGKGAASDGKDMGATVFGK